MVYTINQDSWKQEAEDYIKRGNYLKAINLYESAICQQPEVISHYCNLGLALLLDGQETEAQMTWMLLMSEADEEKLELYTSELVQLLHVEAEKREKLEEYSLAWGIRQHIREISPVNINNLLKLCKISIKLEI